MYPRLSDIFRDLFGFSFPLPIYSFGAMVALAALTAGWLLRKELGRMYRTGRIGSVALPVEGKKGKTRQGSPAELSWTLIVMALVTGLLGARLLFVLGNLDDFFRRPFAMLFSAGGFTFYGGFLLAAAVVVWYARNKGIGVADLADAVAPPLMIGYGIGRLGCHLAGDGDWGIPADLSLKPDWLPTWLWAETYPNNILGVDLAAPGVYPTPIYEFAAAALLFGILWAARKHPFKAGWLFSLYLLLNGLERFFIEKLRINTEVMLLGTSVTRAQIIAVLLMVAGIVGLIFTSRHRRAKSSQERDQPTEAATSPVA